MKKICSLLAILLLVCSMSACSQKATIVPDFTGHDVSEVYDWCAELDRSYACEVSYIDGNGVEKDLVMEQSVKGGSRLESDIVFHISNGVYPEINVLHVNKDTNRSDVEEWKNESGLESVEFIEENSDTVPKNCVIRIEPTTGIHKDTPVKAYISIGPKEAPIPEDKEIVITFGDYIGLTVAQFEEKAKQLGLKPNHNTSRDRFSADVEFGNIAWHGSGTYVKDEVFNYGICINEINVSANQFYGYTENDFISAAKKLTLVPVHLSERDSYSTRIDKGDIVTHGYGTYVKGEDFKYGLALGPAKVKGGYEGASEEVFINYLSSLTLKGKRSVQSSETVKEGRIISYNTGNYSTGDSVSYVVSAGPDPSVQVRNFAGESEETFLTFLKNNGLKAGIRSVQSSMTPAGMIISNDSGTKKKGDTINYVVSSGPVIPTAHLDSLEYLRNLLTDPDGGFAEARDRADIYLRSSGFIDFEITSEFSALYHPGTILYVKVDGNYHYDAADYPVYTPIVIGISSMLMGGE